MAVALQVTSQKYEFSFAFILIYSCESVFEISVNQTFSMLRSLSFLFLFSFVIQVSLRSEVFCLSSSVKFLFIFFLPVFQQEEKNEVSVDFLSNCFNISPNFVRFLVLVLIYAGVSHQFELNCVFEKTGWDDVLLGSAMACKVKNLNVTSPRQMITKVLPESKDKVINALLILEQNCEFFPSGVAKYFNNLEGIAVQKSNLKKITKSDLKSFWNLRSISLFGNKLKVIENELFRYNPRLELISLFNNQLQHIFPSAFENLVHLKILYLNSNPCISQDALEPAKLDQLKCELITKCPSTEEMKESAEIESEKLRFEEENMKMKVNFDAVSKNLATTKRQLERTREGFER